MKKKTLLGFSVIGIIVGFVYALGLFRNYLETKFNEGYEFSFLFIDKCNKSNEFSYCPKVDYSFLSVFLSGVSTLIATFIFLCIGILFVYMCYGIGNTVMNLKNK